MYRRQGSAKVGKKGGRGMAKGRNARNADRAEAFEDALARVSTQLAEVDVIDLPIIGDAEWGLRPCGAWFAANGRRNWPLWRHIVHVSGGGHPQGGFSAANRSPFGV